MLLIILFFLFSLTIQISKVDSQSQIIKKQHFYYSINRNLFTKNREEATQSFIYWLNLDVEKLFLPEHVSISGFSYFQKKVYQVLHINNKILKIPVDPNDDFISIETNPIGETNNSTIQIENYICKDFNGTFYQKTMNQSLLSLPQEHHEFLYEIIYTIPIQYELINGQIIIQLIYNDENNYLTDSLDDGYIIIETPSENSFEFLNALISHEIFSWTSQCPDKISNKEIITITILAGLLFTLIFLVAFTK